MAASAVCIGGVASSHMPKPAILQVVGQMTLSGAMSVMAVPSAL